MRIVIFALLMMGIASVTSAVLGPLDGENLVPVDLERVNVGDTAPDFSLKRSDETPVTLSQFRDKQAVVLVFYRGHW